MSLNKTLPQSSQIKRLSVILLIVCPEFSTSMECFNESRVYLKYMNNKAEAKLFIALLGCAGG